MQGIKTLVQILKGNVNATRSNKLVFFGGGFYEMSTLQHSQRSYRMLLSSAVSVLHSSHKVVTSLTDRDQNRQTCLYCVCVCVCIFNQLCCCTAAVLDSHRDVQRKGREQRYLLCLLF